jgi:hypothetical protein
MEHQNFSNGINGMIECWNTFQYSFFKKSIQIFIILFFISISESRSQTMILQVDRAKDSIPGIHGPNLKRFVHFFMSVGFVAGSDERGARINYFNSMEYALGVRWKYKISSVYSLGHEWKLNNNIYKLKQEEGKILPDTSISDAERLQFYALQVGFYNRFNFDPKRGNYIGNYLDIGIRAEWDYAISHIVKNDLPDGSNVKSSVSSLPYVNRFNYSVFGRIGLNKVLVYASYRLSDLFKPNYHYPELPRLNVGIELAVFRN